MGRILWTFAGIAAFGLLLLVLLTLEIWALSGIGVLTESTSAKKYLLLIGLLIVGLLLSFWLFQIVYDRLREGAGKPKDHVFEQLARFLDVWFLNLDWCVNKTRWGNDISAAERFFVLPGHSLKPTVVAILLAGFLVLGPRLPPVVEGMASYGLVVAGILGILVMNCCWRPARFQFVPHLAVLGLVSAVAFFWSNGAGERVIDSGPYRHLLIPAFWLLAAGLAVGALLGPLLLRKYAGRVAAATCAQQLDLPGRHERLGIDSKRFIRSLLKAPVFHLVEILYWPSLAVVFVANVETMGRMAFFLGVAAWVVYALGEMHEELDNFLSNLKRALFRGPQLLVGIFIILLAAGRLFDNSYIRTLVEGDGLVDPANTGVVLDYLLGWTNNWVLMNYLASAYLLAWYFGYWINRFVSEPLLAIFDEGAAPGEPTRPIKMHYRDGAYPGDGSLVIHESERYALLAGKDVSKESCVKRILCRTRLINEGIRDDCQVNVSGRKRNAKPANLAGREFKLVLVHRLRFYFTALYLGLAAGTAWGGYWLYDQPQRAELVAQVPRDDGPGLFNLQEHLFSHDKRQGRPAILLAASGGGTRAALYTYSVLGGLHDLGVLEDVVLASGVSGGSAAIAYFAMHREELVNAERDGRRPSPSASACQEDPETCRGWARFGAVMGAPFIQDALRGLTEWRMAWGCEGKDGDGLEGVRLGVQLQESFDRWYAGGAENGPVYADGCADPPPWPGPTAPVLRLGDQTEVGLIFNTALAGRFDSCPGGQTCDGMSLAKLEHEADERDRGYRTSAQGKGGRLILTNLQVARNERSGPEGPFPDESDGMAAAPGDYLTYKVVNAPAIPLVSAAALSANFPPVFPNAAVDVDGQSRYWVTDGGAADNRGIISLLYALEGAINAEIDCRAGAKTPSTAAAPESGVNTSASDPSLPCGKPGERRYPQIHIVMAEASATDPTYSQDRGITTTFGAAERFASQLMVDKLKQLARLYEERLGGEGIYLHKLAMPLTLRSAGGIGTHWMLPAHLTLREPAGLADDLAGELVADGVRWPASPDPVQRFLRFTPPGVDISGEQAKRLVEALHWFPLSPADADRRCASDEHVGGSTACGDVQKVWDRWICNDPQQPPYPQGWQCLERQLIPAAASGAENPDIGCPAVADKKCTATRVTWNN